MMWSSCRKTRPSKPKLKVIAVLTLLSASAPLWPHAVPVVLQMLLQVLLQVVSQVVLQVLPVVLSVVLPEVL